MAQSGGFGVFYFGMLPLAMLDVVYVFIVDKLYIALFDSDVTVSTS